MHIPGIENLLASDMLSAVYWLVIKFYAITLRIASLFHPKAKLFVKGRRDLLKNMRYALLNERRPRIWMHCASLGEFEQGRPVLEKLRAQYPQYAFVLTFFSPSGYEARRNYDGADYIFYLPVDGRYNAKRFLSIVQPKLAIFVKYEFWYFYLSSLNRLAIPTILISAVFRKEQAFFKWYGTLHRRMLQAYSHIFVQDEASAQLLQKTSVPEVTVAGDTRFDRVIEAASTLQPLTIAQNFCKSGKIIVAGSTWQSDEVLFEKLMQILPEQWKLIVVPHEIDEAHINEIETRFSDKCIRWTEWNSETHARVLIVNEMGLLLRLYSYADVSWIGGGLDSKGVHNVLEAAVYGRPVAFGPVYDKYIEAKELLASGGAISVDTPEALKQALLSWKKDQYSYAYACKASRDYVFSKDGATRKILDYLEAKKLLTVL